MGILPLGLSRSRTRHLCWRGAFLAVVIIGSGWAQDRLCFLDGSPRPTIDGVIGNDDGWLRSNQYVFSNGTSTPDAIVQMRKGGNALFLSFEVNNDSTFDDNDVIVLTLAPDPASPATHRRIHIYPVVEDVGASTTAPGSNPNNVDYWTNSSTWNGSSSEPLPAWLQNTEGNIKITSSSPAVAKKSYNVEMKIPITTDPNTGVDVPSTGDMGLYFNILRVTELGGAAVVLDELHWPESASNIGGTIPATAQLETNTPPETEWGEGGLSGPCPGVAVTDVYTNHPTDPSAIDPNGTNVIMSVVLENTGASAASGVYANIKSTRFGTTGSPSAYGTLPGSPTGTINLASGAVGTVSTSPWDVLNDPNRDEYLSWPNVCSRVELNATGGLVGNKYYYWNLRMGTASKFEHKAFINTKGFGRPTGDRPTHKIILYVQKDNRILTKARIRKQEKQPGAAGGRNDSMPRHNVDSEIVRPQHMAMQKTLINRGRGINYKVAVQRYFPKMLKETSVKSISMLSYRIHPYLLTNDYIIIREKRYSLRRRLPGWEYLIAHNGVVDRWRTVIPEITMRHGKADAYAVDVAPGETRTLSTRVETQEEGEEGGGRRCFEWFRR
ncbi:MAG: hypothetical protein GF344_14085 [Chitinivibrionales bacterium]|nr:hypothetical protein [Chitinivibrionales bacterium]MBD3357855.1 hypothetical protein [Chitinivibrionales bacterium]